MYRSWTLALPHQATVVQIKSMDFMLHLSDSLLTPSSIMPSGGTNQSVLIVMNVHASDPLGTCLTCKQQSNAVQENLTYLHWRCAYRPARLSNPATVPVLTVATTGTSTCKISHVSGKSADQGQKRAHPHVVLMNSGPPAVPPPQQKTTVSVGVQVDLF